MVSVDEIKQALRELSAMDMADILGKDFLRTLFNKLDEEEKVKILGRSQLSNTAVMRHRELGNIIIEPFNEMQLNTASYDVRLGQYFYEEQDHSGGSAHFNIYDPEDVSRVWGEVKHAMPLRQWLKNNQFPGPNGLKNISLDDLIIPIKPGGTILGHTIEFIGGHCGITTHMKARSSFGRCFMEVCKCAGEGDVGFCSRWTMEFTNNSEDKWIPLVVGRRLAQIVFLQVEPITGDNYAKNGKYQVSNEIEAIKANWNPENMLPKLWEDYEVKEKILGTKFLDH